MDRLEALSAELRSELGPAPAASEAQWRRLQRDERLQSASSFDRRYWIYGFALGLAALLLWVTIGRASSSVGKELTASEAPLDHRLDDGSVLVLERDSQGRLEEDTKATTFHLEAGKVRLEVAPQHGRKFEVVAAGYVVTVVGTRFDVSLDASGNVEVFVTHGIVTVTAPGGGSAVRLAAGERLEGDSRGAVVVHREKREVSSAHEAVGSPPPPQATEQASPTPEAASAAPPVADAAAADWRALYATRRYGESLAAARRSGVERLLKELDAAALSDLADVARLGGDPSLGVRVLRTLRSRFASSPQASRAAFLLGRAHALSGSRHEAVAAFEAYLAEDPRGVHSVEALGRLMELYSDLGDRSRARSAAERYLQRAPKGPYERLARSLIVP